MKTEAADADWGSEDPESWQLYDLGRVSFIFQSLAHPSLNIAHLPR